MIDSVVRTDQTQRSTNAGPCTTGCPAYRAPRKYGDFPERTYDSIHAGLFIVVRTSRVVKGVTKSSETI